MIELLQITNDPEFARHCDCLGGFRMFVDLERNGKAQRQAGRSTFISTHQNTDIDRVKAVLRQSRLMVRLNPLYPGTPDEVDDAIERGADMLMLPMFRAESDVADFCAIVKGRVPVVPLLETREALLSLERWIGLPGLGEVFVGLNDLHVSLGCTFMFEPLAQGLIDEVARAARRVRLPFGFGGIARIDEGMLAGRDVLAEHLRLGSSAVILSRTFHRSGSLTSFEHEVAALRALEASLRQRDSHLVETERLRIARRIRDIAADMELRREAGV